MPYARYRPHGIRPPLDLSPTPPPHSTTPKRAWRLSCHYFLGPEKQRERDAESDVDHRNTGDLSQYVAILDVHLSKRYVEVNFLPVVVAIDERCILPCLNPNLSPCPLSHQHAEMRLTFPYLIGPGTWAWHHFVAERAAEFQEKGAAEASDMVVKGFAEYFKLFVS